jgi:hypothetical protein
MQNLEVRPDLDPEQKRAIQEQLGRLVRSPAFSNSQRCQQLLNYVVTNAVSGSYEMLRERVVGAEVFGRTAAYDTGEDSIVRVRANDVRKRLAQYYDLAPGRDQEVRIQLAAGSYVPEFVFPPATRSEIPALPEKRTVSRPPRRLLYLLLACILGAIVLVAVRRHPPAGVLDRFWAPVIQSPEPALFCLGHAQVFTLSHRYRDQYFRAHPPPGDPEPRAVTLDPKETLLGEDLVSVQGQFVGVGGAQSVQMLSSLLAAKGKKSSLRIGSDLSFADLRNHPTILIGAFSNRWTLQVNRQLRFYFDEATGEQILDRDRPGIRWQLKRNEKGQELVDYAIITRLLRSDSGEVLVDASGITQYGCKAAGELLTSEAELRAALSKAPANWPDKNLQIVLRSRIVGATSGPPDVEAVYFW